MKSVVEVARLNSFSLSSPEVDAQPCATVLASGSVVPLGSPVTATCVIRDDCPLVAGQAVRIEWRLGDRILPGGPADAEGGRVSRVVIPSFNLTREFLTCCVQASPAQVVAGVEIRAGCEAHLNRKTLNRQHLKEKDFEMRNRINVSSITCICP